MIRSRNFFLGVMLVAMAIAASIAGAQQGTPYTLLKDPQATSVPGKIEVIEFFWYGCPHCNALEPMVEAWEKRLPKDVVFRQEHVIWEARSETSVPARLYLTLRTMSLLDKYHRAAFGAVHKEKMPLRDDA